MFELPKTGPVLLENRTKQTRAVMYIDRQEKVTQKNRVHTHNRIQLPLRLGSSLDLAAARAWDEQKAANDAARKNDRSVPKLSERTRVWSPVLRVDAETWEKVMATPGAVATLEAWSAVREVSITSVA